MNLFEFMSNSPVLAFLIVLVIAVTFSGRDKGEDE